MNKCNIVKDLLPLYKEDLLSKDSVEFVESHIKDCEECRKISEESFEISQEKDTPLGFLKRDIKREKKKYGLSILFSCIALFVIFSFHLTKPIHFEDDGKLYEITRNDKTIILTFDEKVTNVNVEEDSENIFVNANTTLLDRILNRRNKIEIKLENDREIYYSNQNKMATKINSLSNGGAKELPRLALRTLLSFLSIFTGTILIYLFFFRKNMDFKTKFQIITAPISVILAFLTITGLDGATYYLKRDSIYILILGICYYVVLNSIYNIKNSKL